MVLQKGENFVITPYLIERHHLSSGEIIEISTPRYIRRNQTKCVFVLRRLKPSKSNISRQEWTALKKFKDDSDVVVLLADKSNATVNMKKSDYKLKVQDLLQIVNFRSIRNPIRIQSLIEIAPSIEPNL